MEATELRIGNWVRLYPESEPTEVTGEEINKISYGVYGCYPIPITEEWLERFRFEYDSFFEAWWLNPTFTDMGGVGSVSYDFRLDVVDDQFVFSCGEYKVIIKYVHQLQNLYFALQGVEL